jgi:thioredoxin reductase
MTNASLPIAIIGAGPIGLAAAAHVIERGETPIVFEAGNAIGSSVREWAHVDMFSPWEFNVDATAARLLGASGWLHPPKDVIPTGGELIELYLEPLAKLPQLAKHIHLDSKVVAVSRRNMDKVRTAGRDQQPFVLRIAGSEGESNFEARAVIDASGTWTSPNPIGSNGFPALGEKRMQDRIFYGMPKLEGVTRARYAGRKTLVIGSGHSAINALLDLSELKQEVPETEIVWAMRKENIEEAFGGEAEDALAQRGALGSAARSIVEAGAAQVLSPFRISALERKPNNSLRVLGELNGTAVTIDADEIIVATGFRPDLSFLREIRLTIDPWLESSGTIGPLIDPNLHSCGSVRPHGAVELAHVEKDFYIVGMKSYGRAPTFLLTTGHEQVRSIMAELTGDHEAARKVELKLPETGVCKSNPRRAPGAAPTKETTSCCAPTCCGGTSDKTQQLSQPEPAAG